MYSPVAARFLQRDPKGYIDGMNFLEYCRSGPLDVLDPFGLDSTTQPASQPSSRPEWESFGRLKEWDATETPEKIVSVKRKCFDMKLTLRGLVGNAAIKKYKGSALDNVGYVWYARVNNMNRKAEGCFRCPSGESDIKMKQRLTRHTRIKSDNQEPSRMNERTDAIDHGAGAPEWQPSNRKDPLQWSDIPSEGSGVGVAAGGVTGFVHESYRRFTLQWYCVCGSKATLVHEYVFAVRVVCQPGKIKREKKAIMVRGNPVEREEVSVESDCEFFFNEE